VLYSEHLTGDGQEMFEHAAKLNWEGSSPRTPRRHIARTATRAGLRSNPCRRANSRSSDSSKILPGVAALYLGKREGKDLVYMGKVGTGWSRTISSQIRKQLDTVVSLKSKQTKQVRKPKATWVDPVFVQMLN